MKKHRLLMTPENAQKCFEGTKTVTRRRIKDLPPDTYRISRTGDTFYAHDGEDCVVIKPRYQPGDIVGIAERHWRWGHKERNNKGNWRFAPRSCIDGPDIIFHPPNIQVDRECLGYHCISGLFLPFDDARTHWMILDVRPERLQDITEADCIAEGVEAHDHGGLCSCVIDGYANPLPADPRELADGEWRNRFGFRILWDSINAKRGYPWAGNWRVWRYEGKKVTP